MNAPRHPAAPPAARALARDAAAATLARGLLPPGVAVAGRMAASGGPLPPDEAEAMAAATPSRRAEFAAGRAAARAAMAELGLPEAAIPMAPDRAPVWPGGVTGSITHGGGVCLAAVARTETLAALGIDLEPATPLDAGLEPLICRPAERAWLDRHPPARRGLMAKLIFCAKEAAYKCQYPIGGALLGFEALEIAIPRDGRFTATFTRPAETFASGDRLEGRFAIADGLIAAAVTISAG